MDEAKFVRGQSIVIEASTEFALKAFGSATV